MATQNDDFKQVRAQIAALAARMIAQDGADYATAKRKAARQVVGTDVGRPNLLPDDVEVEEAVRQYQALFHADTQPARLQSLRTIALQVMEALADFNPYLTGAVLGGTAGEHDDINLQLFADSSKEVVMFLLDKEVQFELSETPHFKGGRQAPVEVVTFTWRKETVHAELYEMNDLRGALKPKPDGRPQRIDAAGLRALLSTPSLD